jgi:hypothetical protein
MLRELMRATLPVTICLLLSFLAGGVAAALGAQPSSTASATPAAPATPAAHAATPSNGANTDGDAAAKHAKRTACLKNAKAKRLVGAPKTAFIKECVGAPSPVATP